MKKSLFCFLFVVIAIPILAQMSDIEWENKGLASATLSDSDYEEAWNLVSDVLLFEKVKIKGAWVKTKHEPITVEKDAGLIAVQGLMGNPVGGYYPKYRLRVSVKEKDDSVIIKCKCVGTWRKKVIEWFFKTLKEKLEEE